MECPICESCELKEICESNCAACRELSNIYAAHRAEEKTALIKALRAELNLVDYEVADDLRELGEAVIKAMPELHIIPDLDIKVAYVRGYYPKRDKGKEIQADCRKTTGTYTAFLPYDFVITFYEPNISQLSENQRKILMLHELRHIGVGERGLRIENHEVEDFVSILHRYGIEWNGFDPDILLVGGDNGKKENIKRGKQK